MHLKSTHLVLHIWVAQYINDAVLTYFNGKRFLLSVFCLYLCAKTPYMKPEKVIEFKTLVFEASLKMRPFVRFLKENKIHGMYHRNHKNVINDLTHGKYRDTIIYFTTDWSFYHLQDIISIAFVWDTTPEGYAFWFHLHHMWGKIIGKMAMSEKDELHNIVLETINKK